MKRFLSLGILGAIVLSAMLYAVGVLTRDRAFAEADRALEARALFFANTLDRTLQQRMMQTFTFAALPSVRAFAASDPVARQPRAPVALTELRAIVAADPNVRAASVVDPSGVVIMTTDNSMLAEWGARGFTREALQGHMHASVPARQAGETVQFFSAPILDNLGEIAGALILQVNAQEMWSALDAPYAVVVVDEIGVRVMDRSFANLFVALASLPTDVTAPRLAEKRYGAEITQIRATDLIDLADAVKRGGAAHVVYRDAKGRAFRAVTHRLITNPWTVIAFDSEDEILAPVRQQLFAQMGVAVVTALVVIAAVFAAQSLLQPTGRRS